MKRGMKFAVLVLGIFVLFISMIAGISAACSSSDQIIMKLYNSNNSHGALWNDTLYSYDICYDSIFGVAGSGIHTCSGTNSVLWLYQINNSHASTINANGYNTPVCYGDLACRNVTTACAADEKNVVRLYQDTNSHISNASDTNYPIKICCKAGGAIPTAEVYWANMQGTPITESSIGSTVWMIYKNKAGPDRYDFKVIEDDIINNDDIRTISPFNHYADLVGEWTITQADFDKGNIADAGELIDGKEEFRFIVNGITSEQLIVKEGNYTNPLPTTNITNPKYKDIYVINQSTLSTTNILFTQISSDINDDLKLTWNFGDGSDNQIFENILTTGLGDTYHNYNTPGTKSIKLTAEEMSPPRAASEVQSASDATEIYVYGEGVIVFAIITTPNPDEMQKITSRFVEINASATHVVNCSYDKARCDTASIAAGMGSCYVVNDTITKEGIWCYKFPSIEQNKTKMEWTFDNDISNKLVGYYGANYSKVVEFVKIFDEPGKHTLNLRAIYTTP